MKRSQRMGGAPAIIYHLLGLNCQRKPKELMGTNHGVTQFPEMISCDHCKVGWDQEHEQGTMPDVNEHGAIPIPEFQIAVVEKKES